MVADARTGSAQGFGPGIHCHRASHAHHAAGRPGGNTGRHAGHRRRLLRLPHVYGWPHDSTPASYRRLFCRAPVVLPRGGRQHIALQSRGRAHFYRMSFAGQTSPGSCLLSDPVAGDRCGLPPGGPEGIRLYLQPRVWTVCGPLPGLRVIPGHRLRMVWKRSAQIRIASDSAAAIVVHPGGWPDLSGSGRGGYHLPRRKLRRTHNGGLGTMFKRRYTMVHTNRTAQRTWCLAVWLLAVFGLIAGIPSLAQSGRGTLTGSVKDTAGASISGASLTLKETNTGSRYAAVASTEGLFTFPELQPGTYTLAVTSPGFESYMQIGITVSVGSTATVNAVLKVGSATQTITVTGDASQLQTESSDIGTTVPSELIEDLPLQYAGSPRNPLAFVMLTPGFSGVNANSPTDQGGFKLNGGQQAGTEILVDGATIELASANLQMNYGVSVEAVREFKVITNTFDAGYGRMSGGLVNLVTKSGTNTLHGAIYDILKNRVLDANSWSSGLSSPAQTKPIDTQNDFGAIISGPVYIPKLYNGRDKTFFMFNYEGYRWNTGGVGLNGAPTHDMTTGDFSALLTPVTVYGTTYPAHILYDYTTCTGVNQGKECKAYPGNIITTPPDAVYKASIPYMPQAPAGVTSPYQNLSQTSLDVTNANMYEIRIDQNIGTKQKISGSYDYDWRPTGYVVNGAPLDASSTNQRTHYVRFGYDYIFRPTLLNHFNAGFSRRYRQEFSGIGSYGGNYPSKLGLKGVSDTTFPVFNYDYPNRAAIPSNGANQFYDNTYQYDDNVSWQRGRNSFTFG